jgi:hypothetical protein
LYKRFYKETEVKVENHNMRIIDEKTGLNYIVDKESDIPKIFSTIGRMRTDLMMT